MDKCVCVSVCVCVCVCVRGRAQCARMWALFLVVVRLRSIMWGLQFYAHLTAKCRCSGYVLRCVLPRGRVQAREQDVFARAPPGAQGLFLELKHSMGACVRARVCA